MCILYAAAGGNLAKKKNVIKPRLFVNCKHANVHAWEMKKAVCAHTYEHVSFFLQLLHSIITVVSSRSVTPDGRLRGEILLVACHFPGNCAALLLFILSMLGGWNMQVCVCVCLSICDVRIAPFSEILPEMTSHIPKLLWILVVENNYTTTTGFEYS